MARSSQGKRAAVLSLVAAVSMVVVPAQVRAAGPGCATPGRDGTTTPTGVVNTYYPGSATAAAGATTITLGTATGSATPIAIGDLVLVIQMQDASINSTNTGSYGDGVAGDPATGSTALNSSGLYEYAVAASAVPLAGGSLTLGGGLINTYTAAAPTVTQGRRDFQVIRVPQYVAASLGAALTAGSFNGSTGGVLVLDVDGALNLNGNTASVSQEGFRAGLGRQLGGGAGGTGTDYVNLSANPFHGQKGEGIAGTPQYLYDSRTATTVNNLVDGYPNGSTARGAPGTAGGGGTDPHPTGNDENTGGGGGANGGTGGMGGNSWKSNVAIGGFGGTAFPAAAARVTAGAGGGAGSRNDSGGIANASSGGNGGGIVMIRAGSVTGTGSITADGGTGVAPDNDGGGGGGAGGSVLVVARAGGLGGLTISARGGAGTDAWAADAGGAPDYHGPGGGGGGGVVLTTSAPGTVTLTGGVNGTTTTAKNAYGATPGTIGTQATITPNQVPGAGSGASCTSDLTLAKTHVDPFVRGSTGTYTLVASNVGGTATSGTTTVTDTLPAGLTPTAATGTGWSCAIAAPTVTCTSTDVVASNGAFPAISITVAVAQSAAASMINTASVSGGGEINTANDTASDATTTVARADVAVTKVASSGTVTVGSNVTFTVTATNNGPSDATGVQVTDQLPAGLTFVSGSTVTGIYTSGTGIWNIGALASGATATLTLTATVTTTGSITNTATKTAEVETDPNAANNSASVTIMGQAPDLTLTKSHVGSFTRGSSGSYSLTVNNIGAAASSGLVTVSDPVPAGLTPTAASGTGWTCGIAGQTVTCTRSDALAAGSSYPAITVSVAVAQGATSPLTNTATVAGGSELNTANDAASDATTIVSSADVGVTKVASSGSVTVGSAVQFTITAKNNGPSDASGVVVTDQLPAGLAFVSAVASVGSYSNVTHLWTIGNLATGTSATLTLTATVTTTGAITNTATKTAENEPDPNTANDSASVTINGLAPDLTIAKSHLDPFVRGTGGSYSIVASNVGTAPTVGLVTVTDTVPAGLLPTVASGTGWTCGIAAQTVTCTRSDVLAASGAYPAITISIAVAQGVASPVTNTASVGGGGELNLANDSASDLTTLTSQADIGVSKIASSATVLVGLTVQFTVTATNNGPSDATGVQVTDQLPAGLSFVSSSATAGAYVSGTGIWTIGALTNGSSATLTITATVTTAGAHLNVATKTAETETDPNASNDSASASVNGQVPSDLTLTKSHVGPFVRGSTGSYSLTVNNIGAAASSGLVTVSDPVPAGLTPTTASGTGWTCGIAGQAVTCTRSDALAAGSSYPVIAISVAVAQGSLSPLTNTASVSGGGELNTANDSASDPTSVSSQADVAVTKVASSGSVTVGSTVQFTITAKNNGPTDATGVVVTDQLPAGLAFVSAVASVGSYSNLTHLWTIGNLATGTSATLTLTATVTTAGAITNTATKTAENEPDPNTANDSASVTVNGLAPDLTIAKSHLDPFVRGTGGSYSIVASNVGTAPTAGLVTVTDPVPAGLLPTLATGTGWTCGIAAQTVTCTRSEVLAASAAYPAITISVAVAQGVASPVTNTASVSGGGELNLANDSASDLTTLTSQADISVSKIASSATVLVGLTVQFTVTATNNGPSDATGVVVTDQLPAGLSFASSSATAGAYVSGTGIWTIGALTNGGSATLTITATVTTAGAHLNVATKTAENETDPNTSNDSASASVNGQVPPDLTLAKSHVGSFVRGSTGSYSLTVTNIGPLASNGLVTVSDPVPAGLTPTTASGTGWSCAIAGQAVTCTRSDALAAGGAYPVITVVVAVAQGATSPLTNTATVAGGGEVNTSNDSASDATTIVSSADVGVTKVASSGTVTVGSPVQFTVTATNTGPSDASGVVVMDQLPAGVTYVTSTATVGSYSNVTHLWTIGNLTQGTSAALTLTATVTTTGAITNTATKTAENEPDPNTANDSASVTITGQVADLTIMKSHVDPFVRGTAGSYTLVISNVGSASTAGLVTVTDPVPSGLTPTAASGTGWSCGFAGQVVTCTRADALVAGGTYPSITVAVAVQQAAAATLTNTVTVAGGGEVNLANDTASDPAMIASLADIGVTKTANSASVTVGSPVTYTITAHNAGPSNATGVQLTDLLPPGLSLVSTTPSTGTFTPATGIWNIGALPTGSTATLLVTATVNATGTIMNTVTKSAENESDPNAGNNTASTSISGQPTPIVPGPPNGGMAAASAPFDPLRGSLVLAAALAGFFALLFIRRRSHRIAVAGAMMTVATLVTALTPAGSAIPVREAAVQAAARLSDADLFGKPISTEKPEVGTLATTMHPAKGPITPARIRIPMLGIDTAVEPVGLTNRGLMDVPSNIWDAAWLKTGVRPGAPGQAVIDGHLDSVNGPAVFGQLDHLIAGDRVEVSDVDGNTVTFRVTAVQVAPLDGFPSLRVFGPAKGKFLNIVTCAGRFDAKRKTYDHRLIVFTTLAT